MKKILIVNKTQFDTFPPLLSLKKAFNELDFCVDVLTVRNSDKSIFRKEEKCYEIKLHKKVFFISSLVWYFKFLFKLKEILNNNYQFIWIEGGDTISLFGLFFKPKKNYILQLSELYDKVPFYKFLIGLSVNKFNTVVVPEINRAFIFKVWFKMNKIPLILPNKPNYDNLNLKTNNTLNDQEIINAIVKFVGNRKMLLYQGLIANDRKFNGVVDFVKDSPDYCLVLIGKNIGYLEEINNDCENVYYAGFFTPPSHLEVTKLAHICIMSYDTTSLNKVYCAPNKMWEYTKFNKPILSQNLPGVELIFNKYLIGEVCDVNDLNNVTNSIIKIDENYLKYAENSFKFYNSINYKEEVSHILNCAI